MAKNTKEAKTLCNLRLYLFSLFASMEFPAQLATSLQVAAIRFALFALFAFFASNSSMV
jgi:hypothetical protein